ncbi:hypothetical protein VaNZ11_005394 [Volvox africanus]|uniref:U-box domain-containing protein n=1 Tax=Volvox africanus TaxID=51714 RepID=A0ABQ5RYX4_9CHLO|nr:hypothetical protein VaNZ11_005394 [Volvox africanus]
MAEPGESQASENKTSVNLVELFQAGENGIERRRTDNLFKQLDERQLTEDEQAIIQQRVDLQRKMFQEYERREKHRKQRELQDLCPDLDEAAAVRALELCNWKEEAAAERVSSDPTFLRRVISGVATVEHAPAPKPDRHRNSGSRAVVGPRPRLVDPSQVGAVFVGRFKSRLGPHQISAMGRQQQPAPAARGAATQMAGRRAYTAAAVGANPKPQAHGELTPVAACAQSDTAEEYHDEEMADASRVVEPDSGELAPAADCAETETDDEEVHGEGEDHMEEDPNSADLSDNELHYEDDVLPVMSPLAGKRQRTAEQMEVEGLQPLQMVEIVGVAAGPLNDEPPGASGYQPQQVMSAGQSDGQQQPEALVAAVPAARHQGEFRNLAWVHGDDDEVSSPAIGGLKEATAPAVAAPLATAAVAANTVANQSMGTATVPTAGLVAPATMTAARPRRAKAELAAVLRHVGDMDMQSDVETCSDGNDSDFELGSGGGRRGGGGGAALDAATSSSDSDVDVEDEGSDDFVAPGSRKRRGATGGRRQQQARKRAASGGTGIASRTRQRPAPGATQRRVTMETAPPGAAAIAVATGIAVAAVTAVSFPSAELADVVGSFGRGYGEVATGSGGEAAASPPGQASLPTGTSAGGQAGPCEDNSEATVTEDESPGGRTKRQAKGKKGKGGGSKKNGGGGGSGGVIVSVPPSGGAAISASGHTCRGRVKQKGVKRADLLAVGNLIPKPGWYNAGYIFPAGFRAQTLFRSSVDLDSLTLHTCEILGENGQYWPAPTFVVTAADRPDEPLVAKSCTGCWTAVLRRINGEIEGRRAAGEDLPPPPKTAIAGPEYFGLNQPEICAAIEALDVERKCSTYWEGKMDREAVRKGGQPAPSRGPSGGGARGASGGSAGVASAGAAAGAATARPPRGAPRSATSGGGGVKGRRSGRRADDDDGDEGGGNEGEDDPEETYAGNRWSAVTRAERYRKRCEEAGEDTAALLEQSLRDNPLPGFLDPITLEPVVNPAISPYGHVMGLATWKAVLAEHGRCPFTKQPLKPEAVTVLTKNNIDRYRGRIIQQ